MKKPTDNGESDGVIVVRVTSDNSDNDDNHKL